SRSRTEIVPPRAPVLSARNQRLRNQNQRRRRRHLQHLVRKHQLQPHSPQRRLLHEPEQFQQSRRKPPRSQSSSFLSWVKTFTRATWFGSWSHRALVSLRVNR